MKQFLKILGYVVLGIVVLIGGFAAFINFSGLPKFEPVKYDLQVEITPERVAQGAKIASMQCVICHTGKDGKLSGKFLSEVPKDFGTVYSRNITKDPTIGIGSWKDGDVYYFLRTGIRQDGTFAPAYMPKFPLMADEDVKSVIAWLRSDEPIVQPSQEEPPASLPSFLTKILSRTVLGPPPFSGEPIALPDTTNRVVWGKYLANNVFDCYNCHSADFKTNNALEPEKSEGFYGGGNKLLTLEGQTILTANITPDEETGIGKRTEAQFIETVKFGKKPDGTMVRYPMLPHSAMTESEIAAIYAYLRTIPPISNKVVNPAPK